jgi:hypothetical protein
MDTATAAPSVSRTTAHHIGCAGRATSGVKVAAARCVTDATTFETIGSAASRSPAIASTASGSSRISTL